MNCFSRVMENHQKCKSGNMKILMYLADNYLYPNSFEDLVYASQLLQADAIKYGVEHFRRCRGYTMGSVYWQFNDCWPVASWSSVDSFGRYKALHYAARKFYAPVLLGLFLENGGLCVNISNETMNDFQGKAVVRVCDSDFNVLEGYEVDCVVPELTSKDVFSVDITPENKYGEFIVCELYDKEGQLVSRKTELFTSPKHFEWKKPEISVEITDIPEGVAVNISSDVFAKGVFIDFDGYDLVLSDNFFDITDKKSCTVTAKTDIRAKELKDAVRVMTVYDIGR